MEIVTGDPAPSQEPETVRETLLELAAVIRTIFGAPAPVEWMAAPQASPGQRPAQATPSAAAPVSLEVPNLPQQPTVPHGQHSTSAKAAPAAIPLPQTPVPQIPVPDLASAAGAGEPAADPDEDSHTGPHPDPQAERHSLALLQEIAFLDD